jgi:uncharacterized membrane protein
MRENEIYPPRAGGRTSGRGDFASAVNVGDGERVASAIAGGALALYGLARGGLTGWLLAGVGGLLGYRAVSGHCQMYQMIGVNTAEREGPVHGNLGTKIDREIVVNVPPERAYRVWRNFSNLPRFMSHLERVEELDPTRSRWTSQTPTGVKVSWDAEMINEIPNRLIAWRTTGDSNVIAHAGSVHFDRAPDGRGTIVRVSMQYDPPGGELGHTVASLFGQDPHTQIEQDLRDFKRAVESGELAA